MADKTTISWTVTHHEDGTVTPGATWNPLRGCARVSEGCRNCYAERVAARFSGPGLPYEGLARMTSKGPMWTGEVRLIEKMMDQPLRWKRPRLIFVNSMSDLFHDKVSDVWLNRIFEVMESCPQHTFQILTKRPERMKEYLTWRSMAHTWGDYPTSHIWVGVSMEDQATADERIPLLLETTAAVRWISAEPLLGPIDLTPYFWEEAGPEWAGKNLADPGLDWVVTGGESGPGARPAHPQWFRSIRDQCATASVPFHFKQWGDWVPAETGFERFFADNRGHEYARDHCGCPQMMLKVGKGRSGRLLDGQIWDQYPEAGQLALVGAGE